MSKRNTTAKNLEEVNCTATVSQENNATVLTTDSATPETTPAPENAPAVETQEITAPAAPETSPEPAPEESNEFPNVELFPVLSDGAKFAINSYKVTITGKVYLKEEKHPYTAWDATVITPDGTIKTFTKVRNTAIKNFCHASTGITHNGGESRISKVLTDAELAAEYNRRAAQVTGTLARAYELYEKYTGIKLTAPEIDIHPIHDKLVEDNDQRRQEAETAKAANQKRQARKETRDLQKEIADLIAAGDFAKAAELMQSKANAAAATENAPAPEDAPTATTPEAPEA